MVALAIVVIAVFGVGIGYFAGRGSSPAPPPSAPPAPVAGSGGDQASSARSNNGQPNPVQNPHPMTQVGDEQPDTQMQSSNIVAQTTTNPPTLNTNWEDTVDEIVGSDDPDTNKVKQLFALFPTLPADGQEEVVQHLSNLVEDDNYAPLGQLLKDDSMSQGVLDELMSDVLNRPNTLKLPMLLAVGEDANNPESGEAKDLLELYVGQDLSADNWRGAGDAVTNWLQQNPD